MKSLVDIKKDGQSAFTGGVIYVTRAQFDAAVAGSTIVPDAVYWITDEGNRQYRGLTTNTTAFVYQPPTESETEPTTTWPGQIWAKPTPAT